MIPVTEYTAYPGLATGHGISIPAETAGVGEAVLE